MKKNQKILIIHNIRSTHNVGSIFRTCDAIGIDRIILSGYSPTPLDRFGRVRSDMAKTALGAEKSIKWETVSNLGKKISELKKEGFKIVALEQSEKSIDYKKYKPKGNIAIILGEEVNGITKKLLELADIILEIPMNGKKESLNVSVATGVLLYRLFDTN